MSTVRGVIRAAHRGDEGTVITVEDPVRGATQVPYNVLLPELHRMLLGRIAEVDLETGRVTIAEG